MAAGRRIEALHAQGFSLREIAKQLRDENIPTRRGGQWHASTVRSVLQRIRG
jgi:DNA-binding transcriptional MerR regulator